MIILETTRKLPDHFTSAASSLSLYLYLFIMNVQHRVKKSITSSSSSNCSGFKMAQSHNPNYDVDGPTNFKWEFLLGHTIGGAKNGPIVLILLVLLQAMYNLHRSTLRWMGEWVAEWMDEELNSFRRIKSIFFASTSLFAQSLQKRVLRSALDDEIIIILYCGGGAVLVLILAGPGE